MASKLLLMPLLALAIAPAAYAADGTFDRTLTFSGAPTVSVATGSGYIHVYPGQDNQVHVIGHVHSSPGWLSFGDPEERVREIVTSPPIVQSGNVIKIGKVEGSHPIDAAQILDDILVRNISIDYDITTPAQTTLKAASGSGSLEIGGIVGVVNGEIGSGSIHADNVGANSRFSSGSGSIVADHIHGSVTAETGSGRLDISLSAPGDVQARTGSGGISVSGISGGLRTSAGSGSIDVEGNPTAEWRLESGSGSVHVKVDPNAHFNVDASTGSGGIDVDRAIVMQGSANKHHLSGAVGGGGPTLRASTGSGSITIE